MEDRNPLIVGIKQITCRGRRGGRLLIEYDGFCESLALFHQTSHLPEIVVARYAAKRNNQYLHAPAADQPVVPAILAIQLKLGDVGAARAQHAQSTAYHLCLDTTSAERSAL